MGPLSTYAGLKKQADQQPAEAVQPQQPQIDTSDPINSLAGMLVTPAEREAQQQRMLRNKRRMIAWTGLFDGLRNLGNLYAVSKGAAPQRYTDNPYQTIERSFDDEQKRQDALFNYRDNYAKQLWNLQRQASDDARRNALSAAQARYYDTRDEMARQKQELAEFKAQTDADYKKASLEQKNAINEVKIRLLEGQISKVEAERQYKLIMMGNAQRGTETTVTKPDGSVTTTIKKPAGGGSSDRNKYSKYKKGSSAGSSTGKYDKYKTNKK